MELEQVCKDGSTVWTEDRAIFLRDSEGRPVGILGVTRNISGRRRAEEALRESEARFRSLFENATVGIYRTTPEGRILAANPVLVRILGFNSFQELGSQNLQSEGFAPGYPRSAFRERVEREGEVKGFEAAFQRGDGKVIFVRESARVVRAGDGRVLYYDGIVEDITERKRAEEALRGSEEFNREVIAGAGEGVIVYDRHFCYQVWNPFMEELTGLPASRVLGKNAFDMFPHLRQQKVDALLERALAGETVQSPDVRYHVPQTGKSGWGSGIYGPHYGPNKEIIGVIGLVRDTTKRKEAEEELRVSEARFRALSETASAAIFIHEANAFRYVNPAMEMITGYSRHELLRTNFWEIAHPDVRDLIMQRGLARQRGEPVPNRYEFKIVTKAGEERWLDFSAGRFEHEGKAATAGMAFDVTERKRAEEALAESEEHFRSLVQNATVGIYRTTPDGRILMANPTLVGMLGLNSLEELASRNLEREGFEPSYPRSAFRERIEREGEVKDLEAAWTRRDGSVVFVRESARAVRADDGSVLYYDRIVEDVTQRKQAEESMRQLSGRLLRLQDEERRRIARELHDTTAQSLAALAINLSVVKDSAPDLNARASDCLSESLELAEQCSREIRTISYLLHPPLLDEVGLISALRWFVEGYAQRTGIDVDLEMPPELTRLPGDIELALYRLVQEGLTNIHLHSGSKKAHVCLKCRPDQAVLTVADEGRGLPPGLLESGGLRGAKLGVGIPGMRERITQLGGQFEIVTGSNGTTLKAIVPLRKEQA